MVSTARPAVVIAGASVALITYCAHPRTRWQGTIIFADLALVALMAVHVVSDAENDGFHWSMLLRTSPSVSQLTVE